MAITFRETKGSPLTHDELDQNFREFFFSSSYIGEQERPYGVTMYRSKSLSQGTDIYFPQAIGSNYWIQIKSGSNNISSSHLTGSSNFQYNYDTDHLSVSGSGNFQGDLVVNGKLSATTFETVYVSSSIIQESGSSVFGNTSDDIHSFTGSLRVNGSLTGSLLSTNGILSGSIQIASDISGSSSQPITSLSSSVASDIADINTTKADKSAITGAFSPTSSSLASRVTTIEANNATQTELDNVSSSLATRISSNDTEIASLTAATSSYLLNTTDTLSGDLTITGNLAIPGFASVSASLASAISASGTSNVSISNNTNNNVITATGTDTLNGESNLTFDGSTLGVTGALTVTGNATINGTLHTKFTSSDTDINALIGGTNTGTLIEGLSTGHVVIGIREDNLTDSFAVIGGGGDYYSSTNYDKLMFKVSGSGQTYIGGPLDVDGAADINGNLSVTGTISATSDIIAYSTSDERLKENITPISDAINKINQIGGYGFDWNSNSEHSGHDVGVIAQEIEKVLPEVVTTRDNGYKAVRYEKIVALLIEAVKEQQLQIEELKSKL